MERKKEKPSVTTRQNEGGEFCVVGIQDPNTQSIQSSNRIHKYAEKGKCGEARAGHFTCLVLWQEVPGLQITLLEKGSDFELDSDPRGQHPMRWIPDTVPWATPPRTRVSRLVSFLLALSDTFPVSLTCALGDVICSHS